MELVFKALADPTRRLLLDCLFAKGGLTLGALCSAVGATAGPEGTAGPQPTAVALQSSSPPQITVVTVRRGRPARDTALQPWRGSAMTRQAVSNHLALLEQANLISTVWIGRKKLHYLNPVPIHEISERWINKYERYRLEAIASLKKKLEEVMEVKKR